MHIGTVLTVHVWVAFSNFSYCQSRDLFGLLSIFNHKGIFDVHILHVGPQVYSPYPSSLNDQSTTKVSSRVQYHQIYSIIRGKNFFF